MDEIEGIAAEQADDPAILRDKIAELERQEQELRAQIVNLEARLIDWHSAMFTALKLNERESAYDYTLEYYTILSRTLGKI